MPRGCEDVRCYLPTRAEIRAACRAIRRRWSPEEREARRVGPRFPATVPLLRDPAAERHDRTED